MKGRGANQWIQELCQELARQRYKELWCLAIDVCKQSQAPNSVLQTARHRLDSNRMNQQLPLPGPGVETGPAILLPPLKDFAVYSSSFSFTKFNDQDFGYRFYVLWSSALFLFSSRLSLSPSPSGCAAQACTKLKSSRNQTILVMRINNGK